MNGALAAENARLQQEVYRLQAEIERLKQDTLLSLAIVVYACPGHQVTVSEYDMLQKYQIKKDMRPADKTVTFTARRL